MPLSFAEAEAELKKYAAFDWLVGPDGKKHPAWSIPEIVQGLRQSGLYPRASDKLVRGWIDKGLLRAREFEGSGLRIFREWLVEFAAEHLASPEDRATVNE